MNLKKPAAFLCSAAMVLEQFPPSAVYAEDKTEILLSEKFYESITVNEKIYDGKTDANINLSSIVLDGIEEGDDVRLTAKANYDNANSGEKKKVTVMDFELSGEDAGKYNLILPEMPDEKITLTGSIRPVEVPVSPKKFTETEETVFPYDIDIPDEAYDYNKSSIVDADRDMKMPVLEIDKIDGLYVYRLDYDRSAVINYNFYVDKNSIDENSRVSVYPEDNFLGKLSYTKEYDENTDADVSAAGLSSIDIYGKPSGERLFLRAGSAQFRDSEIGENKEIVLSEISLGGDEHNRYFLELPERDEYVFTGNIVKRSVKYKMPSAACLFPEGNVIGEGGSLITNGDLLTSVDILFDEEYEEQDLDNLEFILSAKYRNTVMNEETVRDIKPIDFDYEVRDEKSFCSPQFRVPSGEGNFEVSLSLKVLRKDTDEETKNGQDIKFLYNENEFDSLFIDREPPRISGINLENLYQENSVKISLNADDALSGADNVECSFGGNEFFSMERTPDGSGFEAIIDKDSITDKNFSEVTVKSADRLGNRETKAYGIGNDSFDTVAPNPTYICLIPDGEFLLQNILEMYNFGNYSSKPLKLLLRAEDKTNTGSNGIVSDVKFVNRRSDDGRVIREYDYTLYEDGLYTFEIPREEQDAKSFMTELYICIYDDSGNRFFESVSDCLNNKNYLKYQEQTGEETTQTTAANDTENIETVTTTVLPDPYLKNISSKKWVFDPNSPEVEFFKSKKKSENPDDDNPEQDLDDKINKDSEIYFNLNSDDKQTLKIKISDEGGIRDVNIVRRFRKNPDDEPEKIQPDIHFSFEKLYPDWTENDTEEYSENGYKYTVNGKIPDEIIYEFDTSNTEIFKTGEYLYEITVTDFSKNVTTYEKIENDENHPKDVKSIGVFSFYVDHYEPDGEIKYLETTTTTTTATTTTTTTTTTVSGSTDTGKSTSATTAETTTTTTTTEAPFTTYREIETVINNETTIVPWITETDEDGNPKHMTFRLYPVTGGSDLFKFNIYVNAGENSEKPDFELLAERDLKTEDDENRREYVEFVIDPEFRDEEGNTIFQPSEKHTYDITAEIITKSGNVGRVNYTLHVDMNIPSITDITAEKQKNDILEKAINVVTYGTFSNDSIIFTAQASDDENDSGIQRVFFEYHTDEGVLEQEMEYNESNGSYSCILPFDPQDGEEKISSGNIFIRAYDKMGKMSEICPDYIRREEDISNNRDVMQENITEKPVIRLPDGDGVQRSDGQKWYRQDKTISVSFRDKDSGIRSVEFDVNGQKFYYDKDGNELFDAGYTSQNQIKDEVVYNFSTEEIAQAVSYDDTGAYNITAVITDNAGNTNSSTATFYRDVISPVVEQFTFNPITADAISGTNDFIERMEYGFYFKKEFEASVVVSDEFPSSGLNKVEYRFVPSSGAEFVETADIIDGKAVYTVPAGFKGRIYASAYDNTENKSEEKSPQGFVIDEEGPKINISVRSGFSSGRKDGSDNDIYTNSVALVVTVTDTESGLRSVSYEEKSENGVYQESAETSIENVFDFAAGIGNGWEITGTDENLVTQIQKVFYFNEDENGISLSVSATDRSSNSSAASSTDDEQLGNSFTIDTIAPVITVNKLTRQGEYSIYADRAEFEIVVEEHNFDPELIAVGINNTYIASNLPAGATKSRNGDFYVLNYSSEGDVHRAVLAFESEGDYELDVNGEDMGGNYSVVTNTGYSSYRDSFHVDTKAPLISTNFSKFGSEGKENYFNAIKDSKKCIQDAAITVTEHNFYPDDIHIRVQIKEPGTAHDIYDDKWEDIYYTGEWTNNGDKHTLNIKFDRDGVYKITMSSPTDHANHAAEVTDRNIITDKKSTRTAPVYTSAAFEYDTTPPTLDGREVLGSNADSKTAGFERGYTAVYGSADADKKAPVIKFSDENFDRIEITSTIYTTSYSTKSKEAEILTSGKGDKMETMKIVIPSPIKESTIDLSEYFKNDGVYIIEYTAFDKAGNQYSVGNEKNKENVVIKDTYFRMIHRNVLAYMSDESYYFFTDNETARTLSHKLDDFAHSDDGKPYRSFEITVIKQTKDANMGIPFVQESNDNSKQYIPEIKNHYTVDTEKLSDTAQMDTITLDGSYFSSIVANGEDKRFSLCVSTDKTNDRYIPLQLVDIHIDNEDPVASVPPDFKSRKVFLFKSEYEIVLTDVSDDINENLVLIEDYVDGRSSPPQKIKPSYDRDAHTLKFTIGKGKHDIDIKLVDEAGNEFLFESIKNVWVGNTILYRIIGAVAAAAVLIFAIRFIIRKRSNP